MTLGPVMLDLQGFELSPEEAGLLAHPAVGGVILFARNYASPTQLQALTEAIHAVRRPPLLVAVDQEGGRVQRFRDGFTRLPPAHLLGHQYDLDPGAALALAETAGWLMAAELRAVGVDLSFAPVLDLDRGVSEVIGDRAFHRDPEAVGRLAGRYAAGMRSAGMIATGKHFPGHGGVVADSHLSLPEDRRAYADLLEDIRPFERLIGQGLGAVMAAHVVYGRLDTRPASFSAWWLGQELRTRLRFRGAVFSDDLCMGAARVMGTPPERARAALAAGCDMVLVCNDHQAAAAVLAGLEGFSEPAGQVRLARLHGARAPGRDELTGARRWREAVAAVSGLDRAPRLELEPEPAPPEPDGDRA